MHADERHCVQQYFQTNASYSPLQKQHTHSVLYCFEVVKTKQERTRLFEDHFQEQRINHSAQNGPVIKKKQEEGKAKSKKWRAGENKLVCNRSLMKGTQNREIGKPRRGQNVHSAVLYPEMCPSAGAAQRRGVRMSATRASTHTHREATSTTMSPLQRQQFQNSLVLKRASKPLWKETTHLWHTEIHRFVYLSCLRGPLIKWTCVVQVTAEFRESNWRVCDRQFY